MTLKASPRRHGDAFRVSSKGELLMGMESKFIWMDGELVEYEKANVHFLTGALHYGAAVFEGIRAYQTDKGPAVFRLADHADRLIESAEVFGFRNLSFSPEGIGDAITDTVKANG